MADDRTTRAKLRDAALELVASGGSKALTARAVAERAGASAGLIRHHFGSMAGLLRACDEHVAAEIREAKEAAISPAPSFDPLASLTAVGRERVIGYLAVRLTEDSVAIDALVDALITDAEGYLSAGVAAGVVVPTADEHQRATVLTMLSLGSLTMNRHLARQLGVDLRSPDFATHPGYAQYVRSQFEAFAALFTPRAAEQYRGYIESLEAS